MRTLRMSHPLARQLRVAASIERMNEADLIRRALMRELARMGKDDALVDELLARAASDEDFAMVFKRHRNVD
jgi:hypothetical protein